MMADGSGAVDVPSAQRIFPGVSKQELSRRILAEGGTVFDRPGSPSAETVDCTAPGSTTADTVDCAASVDAREVQADTPIPETAVGAAPVQGAWEVQVRQ